MFLFHCLASALPHSFRVSVSLLSETLPTNLSNSAKNSALSISCAPSTDVSGYAPVPCKWTRSPSIEKKRFRLQRARRSSIFTHSSSPQEEGGKPGFLFTHSQGENPNGIGEHNLNLQEGTSLCQGRGWDGDPMDRIHVHLRGKMEAACPRWYGAHQQDWPLF